MKKLLNKKGFTLIELIVVIAILAILALILIPSLLNYINEANTARDKANARSIYSEAVLQHTTGTPFADGATFKNCKVNVTNDVVVSVTCGAYIAPDPTVTGAQ